MTTKKLPNNASLADDPADVSKSSYQTVTTADIVRGLVDRSGNPRDTMGPRTGTDGLCETCLGSPDQPTQAAHDYIPVFDRVPGVHPAVDDGRVHNYQPGIDRPGEPLVTNDDPALATAEARFRNGSTARQIPYEQGMDPFARPVI